MGLHGEPRAVLTGRPEFRIAGGRDSYGARAGAPGGFLDWDQQCSFKMCRFLVESSDERALN